VTPVDSVIAIFIMSLGAFGGIWNGSSDTHHPMSGKVCHYIQPFQGNLAIVRLLWPFKLHLYHVPRSIRSIRPIHIIRWAERFVIVITSNLHIVIWPSYFYFGLLKYHFPSSSCPSEPSEEFGLDYETHIKTSNTERLKTFLLCYQTSL
jgi:hypothetical protein